MSTKKTAKLKLLNSGSVIDRMTVASGGSSDADLARYLGVSPATVSGWRARNSVPFEHCIETSIETGVSTDFLLLGRDQNRSKKPDFVSGSSNIHNPESMVCDEKMPSFSDNLRRMEQATQLVKMAVKSTHNADNINPSTVSQVLDLSYRFNMELEAVKKVIQLMVIQTVKTED